ncbi:ALK tyrosine kinase receptor [Nymphon striatum]|nr:ALK tyrosine kinase receptor [Nymphon striatum]KAG1654843.1 ALK tyrosine kinase receptor [Nymphon striatum]
MFKRFCCSVVLMSMDQVRMEKEMSICHYLYFRGRPHITNALAMVKSPWYSESEIGCTLHVSVHMGNMKDGRYTIAGANQYNLLGASKTKWLKKSFLIGRITQEFRIMVEATLGELLPSHIALDNLELLNCLPDSEEFVQVMGLNSVIVLHVFAYRRISVFSAGGNAEYYRGGSINIATYSYFYFKGPLRSSECGESKFKCDSGLCIDRKRVCDLNDDCLLGEDEQQSCDEIPENGICTFEKGLCGWHNVQEDEMEWTLHKGSTPSKKTGPSFDHTLKNISGSYLYIEANNYTLIGHSAILESATFRPPPRYHGDNSSQYYTSCKIRFFYHMFGFHIGSLNVNVVDKSHYSKRRKYEIWGAMGNKGNVWLHGSATLPNISTSYSIQFVASRGLRHLGDIAIDDISLSPECFGINVPDNETVHYPTEAPVTKFTTCGSSGRHGPTQKDCNHAYHSKSIKVIGDNEHFSGVQQWTVQKSKVYTIVAAGASGGRGVKNLGTSFGGIVQASFNFTKGEIIHILVGQKGTDACSELTFSKCSRSLRAKRRDFDFRELQKQRYVGGGGGGGGATYIFKVDKFTKRPVPLLVAAGGGGLGRKLNPKHVIDPNAVYDATATLSGLNGVASQSGAGGGGGWKDKNVHKTTGFPLVEGGLGGEVCRMSKMWGADGGFGGGGGACSGGGSGGGYNGGNSTSDNNGQGGYSYISESGIFVSSGLSDQFSDGHTTIVSSFTGCGCEYLCVVVDIDTMAFKCVCPYSFMLTADGLGCKALSYHDSIAGTLLTTNLIIIIVCAVIFPFIFFILILLA